MAYDLDIAARIRRQLARRKNVVEKKMFGGICFLINGRMCCGILQDEMIVRVAKGEQDALLALPHVRVMDFTGRPMKGFVNVERAGLRTAAALKRWVARGAAVAAESSVTRRRAAESGRGAGPHRGAQSTRQARPGRVRNT